MKMNINGCVRVQLTEAGERIYRQSFERLGLQPLPLEKDPHGWCKFQMWDLMHIFGPTLYMGSREMPFVSNIIDIIGDE